MLTKLYSRPSCVFWILGFLLVIGISCRRPETAAPAEPTPVTTPLMPKAGEVRSFSLNGQVVQKDSALVLVPQYPEFVFWVPVYYNPAVSIYPDSPAYRERAYSRDSIRNIFLETFGPLSSTPDSARAELEVFVKWLNATGLTVDDAMDLLQQSGMSHDDVIRYMDEILTSYQNSTVTFPLVNFNALLERRGMTWAQFNDVVQRAGITTAAFWDRLAERNRSPELIHTQWQMTQDSSLAGLVTVVKNVLAGRILSNLRTQTSDVFYWTNTINTFQGGIFHGTNIFPFSSGSTEGLNIYTKNFQVRGTLEIDYRRRQYCEYAIGGSINRFAMFAGAGTPSLYLTDRFSTLKVEGDNDFNWTDVLLLHGQKTFYEKQTYFSRPANGSEQVQFQGATTAHINTIELKAHATAWVWGQKAHSIELVVPPLD